MFLISNVFLVYKLQRTCFNMSCQNYEEYGLCSTLKANFNNVNWQRHITTCRIKKTKLNNKSKTLFFPYKSSLLGSGSSSSTSISNNVEQIAMAVVDNVNTSDNVLVLPGKKLKQLIL